MCEHNTSMVIYAGADTTVEICEWGCDKILVHKILPSGTSRLVREVEHPQLAALREEVERLERIAKAAKAVSDNLSKTEIIDIDNKEYNVWSIVGDAEKDELAAALK